MDRSQTADRLAERLAIRAWQLSEVTFAFTISLGHEGDVAMLVTAVARYVISRLRNETPKSINLNSHKIDHARSRDDFDSSAKVSIIIPTRDRLDLLKPCIDSILSKTTFPSFEIVVIDNDSQDPLSLDYFRELREQGIQVLPYPFDFNFSAICNFGAQHSNGDYLCFLNNDTEVIAGDWLASLTDHARDPRVGVVGSQLLYPDGTVQHLGVALGFGGLASHVYAGAEPGSADVRGLTDECYETSAVTFAAAMVSKANFERTGTLDESFKVGLNDIDFCLRSRDAGLFNVICSRSVLTHHESKSRKSMRSIQGAYRATLEVVRFLSKHEEKVALDHFFTR
jgi:GT2 family glycosyltransferase